MSLITALVTTVIAIKGNYRFYWISAISIYIFSFIAGFSVGQLTIGLTFIPFILALAYTFGWIKTRIHNVMFVSLGILIGVLMVLFVDDAWLFFPLWFWA
ncbi:hypothetical protein [Mesobacillus maritimus]|uniref:hypothetical protein n=1 Tax=Mesobacillus maritimus TaxID=1643336 RepID=UPI001FE389D9|nr:hypothetical protein [Mesobacillus maritimus]